MQKLTKNKFLLLQIIKIVPYDMFSLIPIVALVFLFSLLINIFSIFILFVKCFFLLILAFFMCSSTVVISADLS
ncbi:MAG: hypothetical protein XXXJIFNMEKO3_00179 [Candidatus Erwinia impunctatus]|nr:hypothetical protein XXXJIFNMEKO_00179 [Culicoides impunctatus]